MGFLDGVRAVVLGAEGMWRVSQGWCAPYSAFAFPRAVSSRMKGLITSRDPKKGRAQPLRLGTCPVSQLTKK